MTRTRKIGKRLVMGIPENPDFSTWRQSPETITDAATLWHSECLERAQRDEAIGSGESFPGITDLLTGHACFEDDLVRDIEMFVARSRSLPGIGDNLRADLSDFHVWPSGSSAERVFDGAEVWLKIHDGPTEQISALQSRAAWYGAIFGNRRLESWLFSRHDSVGYYSLAYCFGTAAMPSLDRATDWRPGHQREILRLGIIRLGVLADDVGMHAFMWQHVQLVDRAERDASAAQDLIRAAAPSMFDSPVGVSVQEPPAPPVSEEEIEVAAMALDTLRSISDAPKMRVIHKLPTPVGASEQKSFVKGFETIAGPGVKLVAALDVADIAADLATAWPHASDVVYRILADLREGQAVRIRPTLLVGDPGSGKTRLLTELAGRLGLSSVVYPCASVADGSFGGTPAQWSTRRASTPLELIRSSATGNPMVVLDELERAVGRRRTALSFTPSCRCSSSIAPRLISRRPWRRPSISRPSRSWQPRTAWTVFRSRCGTGSASSACPLPRSSTCLNWRRGSSVKSPASG
jgi:hypothetical protein